MGYIKVSVAGAEIFFQVENIGQKNVENDKLFYVLMAYKIKIHRVNGTQCANSIWTEAAIC